MYADISIDLGNKAAKGAVRGRTTTIRNLAVRDDGSTDHLKDLVSLSGNGGDEKRKESGDSATLWYNNNLWIVGEDAWRRNLHVREKTGYERYGSEEQMAVWLGTLSVLFGGKDAAVGMTFSMPVSQIQAGLRQEIVEKFYGAWTIGIGGGWVTYEVVPELVEVVPEGFGSLAYLCLDPTGKKIVDKDLPMSRVLVFDLGGYTLDVGTFQNWRVGSYYHSFTTGLIKIRDQVNADLKTRFNRPDVPSDILDEVITTGYTLDKGRSVDVQDIVDRATEDLVARVEDIWVNQLDYGTDYHHIIVSGGGGPMIAPYLKRLFNHAGFRSIPAGEAHLANALGSLRYRRFRALVREREASLKQ